MAVNIEVDLDLATREIAEVEAALASIGDGVDFNDIDINDIIDGDLDDALDFDDLDGALSDVDDITVNAEDSQSRVMASMLARIHSELQSIHRAITSKGVGGGGKLSTASFRDFQNWVSENEDDDDSRTGLPFGGIDTDVLGGIDPGGGGDGDGFMDTFPMRVGANEIPPQSLIDTHGSKLGPQDFLNVDVTSGISDNVDLTSSGIRRHGFVGGNVDFDVPDLSDTMQDRRILSSIQNSNTVFSTFSKTLNRLRPRIGQIYNAIAAFIPILIGLAGVAGGAAVALGGLAVAGGIIGILGALGGEADTLKGSVKDLEDQMNNFKKELFQAIEPAADTFAPTFNKALDSVIRQVRGLRGELLGLQQFEGSVLGFIRGSGTLAQSLLQSINKVGPQLRQLGGRAGSLILAKLPGFFEAATSEAFQHQDALLQVVTMFYNLLRVIYNASVILLELLSVFSFLNIILNGLGDILNSRVVRGLIIFIGSLVGAAAIMGTVIKLLTIVLSLLYAQGGILSALASTWIGSFLRSAYTAVTQLVVAIMGLNSTLATTAALMTLVTGGLAALGAVVAGGSAALGTLSPDTPNSMPGGSPGQGTATSMTQNTEINFYGDTNEKDRQFVKDMASEDRTTNDLTSGEFTTF